jgi:hypothetical protein
MKILREHFLKNYTIIYIEVTRLEFDIIATQEKTIYITAENDPILEHFKNYNKKLIWFTIQGLPNEGFIIARFGSLARVRYNWARRTYSNGFSEQACLGHKSIKLKGIVACGLPSPVDSIEDLPTICPTCESALCIEELLALKCHSCKKNINVLNSNKYEQN